jgi:uncharacterized protein
MAAKFVIKVSNDGQFFFNLVSDDGRKLLGSEMYTTKSGAFEGIASVRMNARDATRYDKHVLKDGKAYFTFKTGNQQIIGVSDTFDTEDLRDQALSKVIHSGGDAAILEAAAPSKKSKAEVTKTFEARKLNKRTMRVMPGAGVVIRFGAVLQELKEDERRLLFEYLGEVYEADLRAKGAVRMIE